MRSRRIRTGRAGRRGRKAAPRRGTRPRSPAAASPPPKSPAVTRKRKARPVTPLPGSGPALSPERRRDMDGSGPGEASLGEAGAGSQESAEAELTQAGSQESAKEAELTQTLEHLREELRKAKDDHNMATGAISSLQRQLEIQDSELRRIRSEKEMLQKQLKEQKDQLQAMSDKFCSLTEEQRKEEIMAMMEEKNHSLQQVVMEQESQLARQNELISELEGTISRLRIEVVTSRRHLREQEQAQKEIQSKAEALEHTELQTRVALERMSSKFERCRNKIIQVAFNMEGTHDRSAELTDEQVLQGMQRFANEWMGIIQMLKQRGIKVPLYFSDTHTASPAKRKSSP